MIEAGLLEDILQFYKCPCRVIDSRSAGGFEDYFLQPLNGTTINKLQARVNDFTLAIGKAVTIAFENMQLIFRVKDAGNQPVYNYFEYFCNLKKEAGMIGFGVSPQETYVQYNLFDMPHLLVAGSTGSGKSCFLHSAIVSILSTSDVRFTLIDLKRVELSRYNGLFFVNDRVITDPETAKNRLEFEVMEMQARYDLMEKYGVSNYRNLPEKARLSARVIVIDELADLMLNKETRKSVENSIVRIAQLGRACGMHLILATQRPSTDVITGLIKANIPCRLAFMTASAVDSRVIGVKGAEYLNGKGDGLLSIAGHKEIERLQAFYISDDKMNEWIAGVKQINPDKPRGLLSRLFNLFGI